MSLAPSDVAEASFKQGFLENRKVKLHYAEVGSGPLVLFVHGFPDYWYTWREQMLAITDNYHAVAIDLRGFNLSDKPEGSKNYQMRNLVSDIAAVGRHFETESFTLVGHDWGGAIAWATAMAAPAMIKQLVICNSHHPATFRRELEHSAEQRKASEYAKFFKTEGAHKSLSAPELAKWVKDPEAKKKYIEAFERSDYEAMLSLYQNYPDVPIEGDAPAFPKIQCPVLHFHGLDDEYILPGGLAETWKWMDNEYNLVTVPHAGHFVQQDASEVVSRNLKSWLSSRV